MSNQKRRYVIAAALLKCEPDRVKDEIQKLPESERDGLKELVDWVEGYEKEEGVIH